MKFVQAGAAGHCKDVVCASDSILWLFSSMVSTDLPLTGRSVVVFWDVMHAKLRLSILRPNLQVLVMHVLISAAGNPGQRLSAGQHHPGHHPGQHMHAHNSGSASWPRLAILVLINITNRCCHYKMIIIGFAP